MLVGLLIIKTMFFFLLMAFVFVPIFEIALLIKVGTSIGLDKTILVVIFTAILGAYLVRQQGFATLNVVRRELDSGRMPAMQMAEGVTLLFAGAVLLTPGFITDAFGFALLTPFIRRAIIRYLASSGRFSVQTEYSEPHNPDKGQIIEGEYRERS